MKVRFFAYIRNKEYAGCKEIDHPVCENLRALGEDLSARFGTKFRQLYFSADGSDFGDEIIVFVNGRRAEFLDGINTSLSEDDTILLFPVVAGG